VTAPTEPTPGAPATEPTPQPAPTPGAPEQPTEDITSLPEWAQKQIRDARAEAAKSRTTAKQTAAQEARDQVTAQIAKALGIGQEGEPVSAEDLAGQIEDAQTAAWLRCGGPPPAGGGRAPPPPPRCWTATPSGSRSTSSATRIRGPRSSPKR
jgi:hypothetical protein